MKAIDAVLGHSPAPYGEPAARVMSLADRVASGMKKAATTSSPMTDAAEESDLVSQWAINVFIEKIFFGDEEENGIPELSIDI
jgi:hypothetical protein